MRGGHLRGGTPVRPAELRLKDGSRIRERHRTKGVVGKVVMIPAPSDLTPAELTEWRYYAPVLHASGRLTAEACGVLANYCTARATVNRLRHQMMEPEYRDIMTSVTIDAAGNQHLKATANPVLLRLEKNITLCHVLENDLGLNPAMAVRLPRPVETPEDKPQDFFRGLKRVGA